MQIEQATAKDIDEVAELYGALCDALALLPVNPCNWSRETYPTRATAEQWLAEGALYVLRDKGRIAASIALPRWQPESYERADWQMQVGEGELMVLHTVATHPAFQRRGYSQKLVEFAIEEARRLGCRVLRLDACDINHAAIRIYERVGFRCVSRYNLFGGQAPYDLYRLYEQVL